MYKNIVNNMNDKIKDLCKKLGDKAQIDVPIAPYTTFKVGGPADVFIVVLTKEELVFAYNEARTRNIPVTILGGGSNILVGDKGIRGLVIKNMTKEITVKGMKGKYLQGENIGTVYVEADSGVIFNSFVRWSIEEGYKGIEMHLGLPGTVGGAIYMNSKWTNPPGAVGDVVHQAEIISQKGEIITVPKGYFKFAYDSSVLQQTKEIVLSVTFEFIRESKEQLWNTANRSIGYRRSSQPQGVFTPGCTFRNLSKSTALMLPTPGNTTSAGYLIDAAGLKGHTVGKAQISPVHANFIVNTGGATAKDILTLIEIVKETVNKKFGVVLEEEIVKIGEQ